MKKSAYFVGITYALSAALISAYYVSGGRWNTSSAFFITTLYMYIPLLGALVTHKLFSKEPTTTFLSASFSLNKWFFLAWMLPFAISILALFFSLKMPGVEFSRDLSGFFERYAKTMPPDQIEKLRMQMSRLPVHPALISLLQALIAGFTVNALVAFGEEAGWRGFLQNEFRALGFTKSSLLIGLIWGVWHAPIILMGHNYPEHPVPGVFMMILLCLLLSPLFSYIRLKSGSTLAAAIVHGTFNATAGLPLLMLKGGHELLIGSVGVAGMLALFTANLILIGYDRFLAKEKLIFKSNQTGYNN